MQRCICRHTVIFLVSVFPISHTADPQSIEANAEWQSFQNSPLGRTLANELHEANEDDLWHNFEDSPWGHVSTTSLQQVNAKAAHGYEGAAPSGSSLWIHRRRSADNSSHTHRKPERSGGLAHTKTFHRARSTASSTVHGKQGVPHVHGKQGAPHIRPQHAMSGGHAMSKQGAPHYSTTTRKDARKDVEQHTTAIHATHTTHAHTHSHNPEHAHATHAHRKHTRSEFLHRHAGAKVIKGAEVPARSAAHVHDQGNSTHPVPIHKTNATTSHISAVVKKASSFHQTGRHKGQRTWIKNNFTVSEGCYRYIKKHPSEISCPGNCPFVRSEPTRLCQFKCVKKSDCNSDNPMASFANPVTKRCEACKVAGCYRCAKRTVCAQCQKGFDLVNGICKSVNRYYWTALFVVLGIGVLFAVYYVVVLLYVRDPNSNKVALEAGLKFRERCKARTKNDNGEMVQINLFRNMMEIHRDLIFGPGVMLHFRWMGAIFVWAIFGMILYILAGVLFYEGFASFNFHRPSSRKSFDACEENVAQKQLDFNTMEGVYFFSLTVLYLASFAGSLYLAAWQRRTYEEVDWEAVTMKDFALKLSGFPKYGGRANVEEEQLKFLKEQPQFAGLDIVGVSVCWKYRDQMEEVRTQVKTEFDIHSSDADSFYAAQLTESVHANKLTKTSARNNICCGMDMEMRCVDAAFGIGNFPCLSTPDEEENENSDVVSMLEGMKTSGSLYLVMGKMTDVAECRKRLRENHLFFDHDGFKWRIRAETVESEPVTVIWNGFGVGKTEFRVSIVVGCIAVFLAVILLDVFFYAPYVMYIFSLQDYPGMTQGGFFSGLVLGLLVTVCNQIIYALIGAVADRCAWTSTDSKDCFYCVKYTIAVFFNTCIDLGTVLLLAQGYSVEMAWKMQALNDSTMSAKAMADSPDMQKALYVQLVTYIFPSCTLIPFLIEPIMTTALPFYLGRALVRSRTEVSVQQAEDCLQLPPYDLSRYGDIIVNVMLCCVTMGFTYHDLWQMYLFIIISMVVIYVWDQCRVLRFTTKTVFATSSMDECVMYLMALPCGTLAGCLMFKAYGLTHVGYLEDMGRYMTGQIVGLEMNRFSIFGYVAAAFIMHLIAHWVLLKKVVFPWVDNNLKLEDEPQGIYEDLAKQKPANYFNTNPINCLRSKYIYKHNPPCIYFSVGKEHLLKKNADIGLYFEVEEENKEEAGEFDVRSIGKRFTAGA